MFNHYNFEYFPDYVYYDHDKLNMSELKVLLNQFQPTYSSHSSHCYCIAYLVTLIR